MIYYGCPKCQSPMASPDSMVGQAEKCSECGNVTTVPTPTPTPIPMVKRHKGPLCQHCGGMMKKTTISSGNCLGIAVALLMFCGGIIVFIILPVIGWVLGPIICLVSLFTGGKRSKVWKCKQCGIVAARA